MKHDAISEEGVGGWKEGRFESSMGSFYGTVSCLLGMLSRSPAVAQLVMIVKDISNLNSYLVRHVGGRVDLNLSSDVMDPCFLGATVGQSESLFENAELIYRAKFLKVVIQRSPIVARCVCIAVHR